MFLLMLYNYPVMLLPGVGGGLIVRVRARPESDLLVCPFLRFVAVES